MAKFEYMKSAFCSDLKPRARLVLQCLILHCNQDNQCFPSIKTIAAECGYGVSTIKRALNELLEAGYIEKQARYDERKKGGQTSNLYILQEIKENPNSVQPEPQPEQTEVDEPEIKQSIINKPLLRKRCWHANCFTRLIPPRFHSTKRSYKDLSTPRWTGGQSIWIPP